MRVDWAGLGKRAGQKGWVGRGGRDPTWRLARQPRWRPRVTKW